MAEEGRGIVEEGDSVAGEEKEIVEDSTKETKVRTSKGTSQYILRVWH